MALSCFFFSSRSRHTRYIGDWSSDVCSSDLDLWRGQRVVAERGQFGGMIDELAHAKDQEHDRRRAANATRSEERRVGKECRSRGSPKTHIRRNAKSASVSHASSSISLLQRVQ